MTAVLAFSALPAASKLQRARCARTGRFVAWSRAAALRLPGAPAVVVLTPAPVVVVEAPAPAPVVVVPAPVVVDASPLRARVSRVAAGLGRWARRAAVAAAVVLATALGTAPGVDQGAGQNMSAAQVAPVRRGWTM